MKNSSIWACATAAVLGLTTPLPAAAQEQTKAGAVTFLNLFASQERPAFGVTPHFDKIDGMALARLEVPADRLIGADPYDPDDPCTTYLKLSGDHSNAIQWDEVDVLFHTWSDAMKASGFPARPTIEIRLRKYNFSRVIWPPDEEKGLRLTKALLFLQSSCDPMKATGF